jgi:two-component sensor histidine kinase
MRTHHIPVFPTKLLTWAFSNVSNSDEKDKGQDNRYQFLFDNMAEGFALCDAIRDQNGKLIDYTIAEINPALQRMLGVGPEVVGTTLSASGNDQAAWLQMCDTVLRTGVPRSFEYHNGQTGRWHSIQISRVGEDRMAQFFHDVTERKLAEARQRQLLQEVNHRVKNNLAMVSSVLRMQARDADDVAKEQLLKAVGRVQSISEVYRTLYGDGESDAVDFGIYLDELCRSLAASLVDDQERVKVHVEAERASLPVETVIPLGMVVNELVTNAVKYAYPPSERGVISVRFNKDDAGYALEIGDSGIGLPEDAAPKSGLGMKLVYSLVQQAGGALEIRQHPGVTYAIRFSAAPSDGSPRLGGAF